MLRSRLLLGLLVALSWAGCDTTDLSDAEAIVGRWEPASLNVVVGGSLPVPVVSLGQNGESDGSLLIESRGFFELQVDLGGKVIIPNTDVTINLPQEVDLTGTYTLDDVAKTITVVRGNRTTTLRYDLSPFIGSESLQFVATSPDELVTLIGLDPEDADAFFQVASAASIRFQRPVLTN